MKEDPETSARKAAPVSSFFGFSAITPTPWVLRLVLGCSREVWNTRQRPSLASTATSASSRSTSTARTGLLSE